MIQVQEVIYGMTLCREEKRMLYFLDIFNMMETLENRIFRNFGVISSIYF